MQQNSHQSKSRSSLSQEIDRIQMSPSDRARAKAQMLRAEFIAELLVRLANGLKQAAGLVAKPVQSWLAKSKTGVG
ncbi:MAG: hypothetical protein ACREV9_15920 [Burkholderiales bacterium]